MKRSRIRRRWAALGATLTMTVALATVSHVATAAAASKATVFPAATVKELPSGKNLAFTSLASVKTPLLVWFWAPS